MIRILIISSLLILTMPACTKQVCMSPHKCEKKIDLNSPGATIIRTIITNGANAGK